MATPIPAAEHLSLGLNQLLTRRDLLRVASVGVAGSLLPCGARAAAGKAGAATGATARSVIVLWMAGGVTHIDSFDPKPEAPREVRGTLGTIATTLPGVRFCETGRVLSFATTPLVSLRSAGGAAISSLLGGGVAALRAPSPA